MRFFIPIHYLEVASALKIGGLVIYFYFRFVNLLLNNEENTIQSKFLCVL